MASGKRRALMLIAALAILLVAVSVMGFCLGADSMSLSTIFQAVTGGDKTSAAYRILAYVRLPRVAGAMLSGSALAVAGGIIQAVLGNPLASPNVIGVNTGAGLCVLICSALFPAMPYLLPPAAFLGALATAMIIYGMSMGTDASRVSIVLTGIAMSSILGAGMNTIMIVYPDAYIGSSTFLVGGLSGITMQDVGAAAGYIAGGLLLAVIFCGDLNLISLGSDVAQSLGMNVRMRRFFFIVIAAVLAGAAVSFAGLIGFVGLIVPHGVRFLIGNDNKYVIPASALGGAVFVILCDVLSRVLFSPYELPVGILMAFLGGPFFIYLIIRRKRENE